MKSVIILALVASCLAESGQGWSNSNGRYGGPKAQAIDDTVKQLVANLIAESAISNDANIAALANAKPELVFYSSQLISGTLHNIVWKVEGLEAPFLAAKIWNQPWAETKFRITTGFGQNQNEALAKVPRISVSFASSQIKNGIGKPFLGKPSA